MSDERTKKTMRRIFAEHGLLVDPHTAVGCAATEDHLRAGSAGAEQVIVLGTAHPGKFSSIVSDATGTAPMLPERLARCLTLPKKSHRLTPAFPALAEFLLDSFG